MSIFDKINCLQSPIGLLGWVKYAALGKSTPDQMAELLDMQRSKQIIPDIMRKGVLGNIFKSHKYSKYKWKIYIIAAMSELQQEGYENVGIGSTPITSEDINQWSYEQSKSILVTLGVPEEEIDRYMKYS